MYTENEIFEFMTEEGGFLGRSMYDAIFDKIHALITENEQLKRDSKDNWNKLKEWLEEETIKLELYKDNMDIDEYVDKKFLLKKVLEKLQEIEKEHKDEL